MVNVSPILSLIVGTWTSIKFITDFVNFFNQSRTHQCHLQVSYLHNNQEMTVIVPRGGDDLYLSVAYRCRWSAH